jgi:hypothetical protein
MKMRGYLTLGLCALALLSVPAASQFVFNGGSSSGGAVSDVTNSDGTLTITPTTGNVVGSINLGHANIWTGLQEYVGGLTVRGSTSGVISVLPQTASGTYNFNLPTTAGTAGQLLTSQGGAGAAMTWSSAGAGSVTSVATGNGLTGGTITTTGTISTTNTINAQTGTSYAFLADDGGKTVSGTNGSAQGYTLSSAASVGFTAGWATDLYALGNGTITVTAATSLFPNGLATLAVTKGQGAYIWSDGTNYQVALSLPLMAADTLLGNFTGTAGQYPIASAALSSCSGATNALTYNTTTHAFGCNTIAGGGSGTVNSGVAPGVAYYAANGTAVSDGSAALIGLGGIEIDAGGLAIDDGFMLQNTNVVGAYINGSVKMQIQSTFTQNNQAMLDTNSAGYQLNTGAASSTAPTLVPRRSGSTTGFGAQAAGNISAIIAGVEKTRFTAEGIMPVQATAPVCTGTGTPAITSGSTDQAGQCTAGATATSVIITFNLSHASAPFCVVTSQTASAAISYTVSTTAITVTQVATSGNLIDYHCMMRG